MSSTVSKRNQESATPADKAFTEEKKEVSKIHQANICMFILYGMVFAMILFLFALWYLQPIDIDSQQIEVNDHEAEVFGFINNAFKFTLNQAATS